MAGDRKYIKQLGTIVACALVILCIVMAAICTGPHWLEDSFSVAPEASTCSMQVKEMIDWTNGAGRNEAEGTSSSPAEVVSGTGVNRCSLVTSPTGVVIKGLSEPLAFCNAYIAVFRNDRGECHMTSAWNLLSPIDLPHSLLASEALTLEVACRIKADDFLELMVVPGELEAVGVDWFWSFTFNLGVIRFTSTRAGFPAGDLHVDFEGPDPNFFTEFAVTVPHWVGGTIALQCLPGTYKIDAWFSPGLSTSESYKQKKLWVVECKPSTLSMLRTDVDVTVDVTSFACWIEVDGLHHQAIKSVWVTAYGDVKSSPAESLPAGDLTGPRLGSEVEALLSMVSLQDSKVGPEILGWRLGDDGVLVAFNRVDSRESEPGSPLALVELENGSFCVLNADDTRVGYGPLRPSAVSGEHDYVSLTLESGPEVVTAELITVLQVGSVAYSMSRDIRLIRGVAQRVVLPPGAFALVSSYVAGDNGLRRLREVTAPATVESVWGPIAGGKLFAGSSLNLSFEDD